MHKNTWRKRLKKLGVVLLVLAVCAVVIPTGLYYAFGKSYEDRIYDNVSDVPEKRVAIVFGAGINDDDFPTPHLAGRVDVAADLYNQGKVKKLLMSGDNRFVDYDEPTSMINSALEQGVAKEDMQADFAGRRTYDTCYRAKEIFGVDEAILVTQGFHMTRALYLCSSMGIDVVGVTADLYNEDDNYLLVRDIMAFGLAIWDVNVRRPTVIGGERIEI